MPKLYYTEKMISLGAALPIVVFFDYWTAVAIMVTLGQAHFILTYKYKFFNGHRPPPEPATIVIFSLASLTILLLAHMYPLVVGYTSVCFFLLHNFLDEIKLSDLKQNVVNFFATLPVLLCLWTFLYDWFFNAQLAVGTEGYFLGAAGAMLFFSLVAYRKSYPLYASVAGIIVSSFLMLGISPIGPLYVFFVLTHNTNWYIKMWAYFKKTTPEVIPSYIRNVVLLNAGLFALLGICMLFPSQLKLVYEAVLSWEAFAAWGIMHLIVTFRVEDITEIKSMEPIADYKRRLASA